MCTYRTVPRRTLEPGRTYRTVGTAHFNMPTLTVPHLDCPSGALALTTPHLASPQEDGTLTIRTGHTEVAL